MVEKHHTANLLGAETSHSEQMFATLGPGSGRVDLPILRSLDQHTRSLAPLDDDRELQDPITAAGLLFSRVAMAAARARDNRPEGPRDRDVLERAQTWLKAAAEWLRYVQHGGNAPTTPAFLAGELVAEPWFANGELEAPSELAGRLDGLAATLDVLIQQRSDQKAAGDVYETFQTWAERARTTAGSDGDGVLAS